MDLLNTDSALKTTSLTPTTGLTAEQEAAVFLHNRPVFLSAGAGSGKTSVLVRRYIALLARGLKPTNILAVTFTNESADELRLRIAHELEPGPLREDVENSPNIGTIHSFCYQIISSYGSFLNLQAVKGILTPFQTAEFFEAAYQKWLKGLDPRTLETLLYQYSPHEIRDLGRSGYRLRHHLTTKADPEVIDILKPFQSLFADLEATLFSQGLLSFDDLETFALKILKSESFVRAKLQAQLQSLLIDEFQDTSRTQWDILEHCLGDDPSKLFIVGDPKQSIYSFRYAEVRLFHEVKQSYADGADLALTHNFRTTRSLLGSINSLSKELFTNSSVPFAPMEAGRTQLPSAELADATLELLSYLSSDDLTRAELQDRELHAIATHVDNMITNGIIPRDITLLFRNGDRIGAYEKALIAIGHPVYCQRSISLFETYAVTDLLAFLKAVLNPNDDLSVASLLIQCGLSFQDLWDFRTQAPKLNKMTYPPLFDSLGSIPKLKWFLDLVDSGESRVEVLLPIYFREVQPDYDNVRALLAILEPLSAQGLTVFDLAPKLAAWKHSEMTLSAESGDANRGIRLMTVHASKGLEFPHVILADNLRQPPRRQPLIHCRPGLGSGIKYRDDDEWVESPSYTRLKEVQNAVDQEESARILYVALTRARDSLTLVYPRDGSVPKGSWADLLRAAVSRHSPPEPEP